MREQERDGELVQGSPRLRVVVSQCCKSKFCFWSGVEKSFGSEVPVLIGLHLLQSSVEKTESKTMQEDHKLFLR